MKKRIVISLIISLILSTILLTIIFYKQSYEVIPPELVCKDCSVILITMTNLRYDHMSYNGYSRPTTPNLDILAKESIVFDNAFSHASWTLPEVISLYTGFYPLRHGIMERNDGSKLPQEIPTIIEVLKKAGYTSAAFTGGFDYKVDYGLTGRFDKFERCGESMEPVPEWASERYTGSKIFGEFECIIPKALAWIKKNTSRKFFLHVQGYDAHCPFSQRGGKTFDPDYQGKVDFSNCLLTLERKEPVVIDGNRYYLVSSQKQPIREEVLLSEQDVDHLIAIYDESIAFADRQIGKLLEEIKRSGLFDKTIIVFTSEHGDMFGKKGMFMRGGTRMGTFYDDVLHVPLIVRNPKLKTLRTNGLVSHIDIVPTLLDFLGLRKLNTDGESIIPLIVRGEEVRREVFTGVKFRSRTADLWFTQKSYADVIRTKEWKLIQETVVNEDDVSSKNIELYDIINDKEELHNLALERKDILGKMQGQLSNWSKTVQ